MINPFKKYWTGINKTAAEDVAFHEYHLNAAKDRLVQEEEMKTMSEINELDMRVTAIDTRSNELAKLGVNDITQAERDEMTNLSNEKHGLSAKRETLFGKLKKR